MDKVKEDKVKELVEWVVQQLYNYKEKEKRHQNWEDMVDGIKAFYIAKYQTLIESILSHPDLALIDRESVRPRLSEGDCERIDKLFRKDTKSKIIKAYYDAQIELINDYNYEPVIPLREAIRKEVEE